MKEKEFVATGEQKTAFRFTTNKEGDIIEVGELPADLLNQLEEWAREEADAEKYGKVKRGRNRAKDWYSK